MPNSRNKGATYERQIAAIIHDVLGVKLRRNLTQYQVKDEGDLKLDKFLIECKRYRRISVKRFLDQATRAAKPGEVPMVVMRADGDADAHMVLMWLHDALPLMGNEMGSSSSGENSGTSPPFARDS